MMNKPIIWQKTKDYLTRCRRFAADRVFHPLVTFAAIRLSRMAGIRVRLEDEETPTEWKRDALEDFRTWLADLPESYPEREATETTACDLYTLLVEFIALRQEIKYQNREQHTAIKAQQSFMEGQREMADLFQKRLEGLDKIEESVRRSTERRTASFFLDVRDALQRGLTASSRVASARSFFRRPPEGIAGIVEGYELALRRFNRALSHLDIQPVQTVGRPFDPTLMEAVDRRFQTGAAEEEVLEEVAGGFVRNGQVIRTARVIVNGPQNR